MRKRKKRRSRTHSSKGGLVKSYAEFLPREMFDIMQESIKKNLRVRGIYALYNNKNSLLYVGRASKLSGRLMRHKRRKSEWTKFSFYEIRSEKNVKRVESLLLRIGKPPLNKQKGKIGFERRKNIKRKLKRDAKLKEKVLKKREERQRRRLSKTRKSRKKLRNLF